MTTPRGDAAPRVTVLLPVFNAGAFLRPAVDSVLAQTFRDFELLIIDDGSTDGSLETVPTGCDPRISITRNPSNLGLVATLNRGVAMAKGEFLARMDADDLSTPERIERQIACLERNPEIGVCSTWAEFIDSDGESLGLLKTPTGTDLDRYFWRPSPLVHAAVMGRTRLFREHPYDPQFTAAEDYELWLRLFGSTRFHNIPEPLYRIRRHGQSVSARRREVQLQSSYRALCRFLGHDRVDYDMFLALLELDCRATPVAWAQAYLLASQRTGWSMRLFLRHFRSYLKRWMSCARTSR